MTDLDVVEGQLVQATVGFALTPKELKYQLDQLLEVQKDVLTKDEDYGTIPGTQKPTLLKPGAEKISYLYGLAPKTEIVDKVEDWERPFFRYVVRVVLVKKNTGEVVGDGVGECNNFEKRYLRKSCDHWPQGQTGKKRWPKEHGNQCYERATAETADYTIANTILKMARKRALVDAVLGCTMASHLFTQDAEDTAAPATAAGDASGGEDASAAKADPPADSLPKRKQREIFALGKELELDEKGVEQTVFAKHDVKSWDDLKIPQLNESIADFQEELKQKQAS